MSRQVPLGAMAAEVTLTGDPTDPAGGAGFGVRVYDPDPQRTALIERAREAAARAEQTQTSGQAAKAAGDKGKAWSEGLLAYLHAAQARVHAAYAERPAGARSDKMLDVAQRFVDAGYAAAARNDWKLVQTLETAADVSLRIAATPEGARVKTTRRFVHKRVKHDITVDPNSADPFATFSDHSKGQEVTGEIVQRVVGVVLTVASAIPGTQAVTIPAAVAWHTAQAAKSFVEGEVLGGALSLGSAVGLGTGSAAVLQATAAAGGLSAVAQGAARGDALGVAAGVLQATAAVASGLVATGMLTGEAAAFARAVSEAAGLASVGATSAAAFAGGDLAGGLLVGVQTLLARVAREVFQEGARGWSGTGTGGTAAPGASGTSAGSGAGSGSSWFDLDAGALGWGGPSGPAGVDVGGESAPPPAGGHTTAVPAPGGASAGGAGSGGSGGSGAGWPDAGRFDAGGFDTGAESAPGSGTPPPVSVPPGGTGMTPGAGSGTGVDLGAGWAGTGWGDPSWGGTGRLDVGAEAAVPHAPPQPAQALPTPPVPPEGGVASGDAGRGLADAAMVGVDTQADAGRGGGTQVAANDAASSSGNTAPSPLDPNRPFVVGERYDRALARVEQTPVPTGSAQAPAPTLPEPEGAYQDGPGKLVRRIAAARPGDEAQLRQDIRELCQQPGANRTGERLQTALTDVLAEGDNPAYRQEVLNGIASIAKVDPLQLAAEDMSVPGLVLGGVTATPGKLTGGATTAVPSGPGAGGLEGASNIVNRAVEGSVPNAIKAQIDPRKALDYALNPEHPVGGNKAKVFESALGFNQYNASELLRQLQGGVTKVVAQPGKTDAFGARFTVDIPVIGPKGPGVVRTGWIIKPGSDSTTLTTMFVK